MTWPFQSIIWPALSKLIILASIWLAMGEARQLGEGQAVLAYAAPGLLMVGIVFQAVLAPCIALIHEKYEGSLMWTLMSPLGAPELVAGYALAAVLNGLMVGAVLLAILMLVLPVVVTNWLWLVVFSVLGALLAALIGVFIGVAGSKWDHLEAAFSFMLFPVAMMSGVFGPVSEMPNIVAAVVRMLPFYYCTEGLRFAMGGDAACDVWIALIILAGSVLTLGGILLFLVHKGWHLRH